MGGVGDQGTHMGLPGIPHEKPSHILGEGASSMGSLFVEVPIGAGEFSGFLNLTYMVVEHRNAPSSSGEPGEPTEE